MNTDAEVTYFSPSTKEMEAIRSNVSRAVHFLCRQYGLSQAYDRAEDITQDALVRALEVCTVETATEIMQRKHDRLVELAKDASEEGLKALAALARWETQSLAYRSLTAFAKEYARRTVMSLARMEERFESLDVPRDVAEVNGIRDAQSKADRLTYIANRQDVARWNERPDVNYLLAGMSANERKVLTYIAQTGKTRKETAERFGKSQSYVDGIITRVRTKAKQDKSRAFDLKSVCAVLPSFQG